MIQKYSEQAYALMRIMVGLLFACHGAQKLFGVLGGHPEYTDPQGLVAGIIEFFGGLCIALGIFTSAAAFVASGEMAVAYFKAHARRGFWPIQNNGEKAVLFCFIFLFVATKGSGIWSVDAWIRGRKRSTQSAASALRQS